MLRAASSVLQHNVPGFRPWLIWLNYALRNRRISRDQREGQQNAACVTRYEAMLRWT
jgi:hypothetical protein